MYFSGFWYATHPPLADFYSFPVEFRSTVLPLDEFREQPTWVFNLVDFSPIVDQLVGAEPDFPREHAPRALRGNPEVQPSLLACP